jgi:hypothetical protein
MLSDATLTANLTAAARVAGVAPRLAPPDPSRLRFSAREGRLAAERREGAGWQAVPGGDPAATAAIAAASAAGRSVCVVGCGLGETLEGVDPRQIQGVIVAVEPEPALALGMLARRDWQPWFDAGMVLLVGPDYAGASGCARRISLRVEPLVVEAPQIAMSAAAADDRETGARAAAHAIVERILSEARANDTARRRFAGRYLAQTLHNLPDIAASGDVAQLAGLFPGVPAVIVGAGPSLDETAAALAAVQDRTLVIASDTTLRPLAAAGVRPHVTVAVDPGEANARHLAGAPGAGHTWLVAEGAVHPQGLEGFRGRTFVFQVSGHEPWPWLAGHGLTRGRLKAWGSVITSAMDLALRLGCSPVIFTGADLAFTGERTYCRGTAHEAVWGEWIARGHTWREVWDVLMAQWPDVRVADVHGHTVRTAPHLVAFRDWIVEQAASLPAGRIVNATGAGILHSAGIQQATLETALSTSVPLDRAEIDGRLEAARARTTPVAIDTAVAEASAAVRHDPDGSLLSRWREFAGGTLDLQQVADALGHAARRLS